MAVRRGATGWKIAIAAVVVVAATAFCCYSAVLRPINSACDPHRPTGITQADLAGTYAADAGGRLTLKADGTLTATGLDSGRTRDPASGSGTWVLLPDEAANDIYLSVGASGLYLSVSGSRSEPWLYWAGEDPGICQQKRLTRV